MKLYRVEGTSTLAPGRQITIHATKALADIRAAYLVNIIRDENDMPQDATAADWGIKHIELRQHLADESGIDFDDLDDDDGGEVEVYEMDLDGGDIDFEGVILQNEWLKSRLASLHLAGTMRDPENREKHLISCGMPELRR